MRLPITLQLALLGSALSVSARDLIVRQNGGSSANGLTTVTTTARASATRTSSSSASSATARLGDDEIYLAQVCFPQNSSQDLDLNAPCNQASVIQDNCGYEGNRSTNPMNPGNQQSCFCKSTFFDSFRGCLDCVRLHGGSPNNYIPASVVGTVSSSYCGSSATLGLGNFLQNFLQSTSIDYGTATTGVDVIGNKTDVSLYYTASSASSGAGTVTTTRTSASTSGSSQASAGSTSGSSAAAATTGSTPTSSSGPSSTGSTTGTAASATATGNGAAEVRTGGALMIVLICLACLL